MMREGHTDGALPGLESDRAGAESWHCLLLAKMAVINYLTALCLSFFICKMGSIAVPPL